MLRFSPARWLLAAATTVAIAGVVLGSPPAAQQRTGFASDIARLSEPGGYFDTDNLISNESSYLQVLPDLRSRHLVGGAYVGVGPDQNFTYIAQVRPAIAFIIDIRRDNLLLHLLFKALFHLSRTRVEYLARLFDRPVPADLEPWRSAGIDHLIDYIDRARPAGGARARQELHETIERFGVPLASGDVQTIDRFRRRFVDAGLSLKFESAGRAAHSYYPSYRDMLRDRDTAGVAGNYLASEEAFQFVKSLEDRDLVIPVVGDLGGPSAVVNIGRALSARHTPLSVFYASNVELYLFREGRFDRWAANLAALPRSPNSVVIRSIFDRFAAGGRPTDDSVSQVQRIDDLLGAVRSGRIRTYGNLIASR